MTLVVWIEIRRYSHWVDRRSAAEGDWWAYIIIVCASLYLTCQWHTPCFLPFPFSIALNARASVVLSSFYLSPSYNCLWQGPVSASTASSSPTATSWYRGRIRRRERWWGCLCFFTTYHCRPGTTTYSWVDFRLCSCYIPRTYFRPMGSSIPVIFLYWSSCSTRYPVPNTSV